VKVALVLMTWACFFKITEAACTAKNLIVCIQEDGCAWSQTSKKCYTNGAYPGGEAAKKVTNLQDYEMARYKAFLDDTPPAQLASMATIRTEIVAKATNKNLLVVVIGGGPAGLVTGIQAWLNGANKVEIFEKRTEYTRMNMLTSPGVSSIFYKLNDAATNPTGGANKLYAQSNAVVFDPFAGDPSAAGYFWGETQTAYIPSDRFHEDGHDLDTDSLYQGLTEDAFITGAPIEAEGSIVRVSDIERYYAAFANKLGTTGSDMKVNFGHEFVGSCAPLSNGQKQRAIILDGAYKDTAELFITETGLFKYCSDVGVNTGTAVITKVFATLKTLANATPDSVNVKVFMYDILVQADAGARYVAGSKRKIEPKGFEKKLAYRMSFAAQYAQNAAATCGPEIQNAIPAAIKKIFDEDFGLETRKDTAHFAASGPPNQNCYLIGVLKWEDNGAKIGAYSSKEDYANDILKLWMMGSYDDAETLVGDCDSKASCLEKWTACEKCQTDWTPSLKVKRANGALEADVSIFPTEHYYNPNSIVVIADAPKRAYIAVGDAQVSNYYPHGTSTGKLGKRATLIGYWIQALATKNFDGISAYTTMLKNKFNTHFRETLCGENMNIEDTWKFWTLSKVNYPQAPNSNAKGVAIGALFQKAIKKCRNPAKPIDGLNALVDWDPLTPPIKPIWETFASEELYTTWTQQEVFAFRQIPIKSQLKRLMRASKNIKNA